MISRGEVKLIVPYKLPQTAEMKSLVWLQKLDQVSPSLRLVTVSLVVFPRQHRCLCRVCGGRGRRPCQSSCLSDRCGSGAVPLTALTIMQALDLMGAEAGKTIFISGGTGGVGGMAIPIAKAKGLTVITNGDGASGERVLALGADRFIDYKTEDYTKTVKNVDYVLDTLGGAETEKQMSIMKKGGQLVSLRAMPNGEFAKRMNLPKWKQILLGLVGRKFDKMAESYGVHYHFIFVESNGQQLQEVADIFSKSEIKPSIDTVYPFEEVNATLDKVANGRSRGKTVLSFK